MWWRVWYSYTTVKGVVVKYFPIALNLNDKRVLVVGGGKVALRKVEALLEAKANILIVSPEVINEVKKIIESGDVGWEKRLVCCNDINNVDIVIAATNDSNVNQQLKQWCEKEKVLINVVDRTEMCDFISPAVLRFDKALVAVYSDGKDPVLSRDLKNYLKEQWDDFLSYRHRL